MQTVGYDQNSATKERNFIRKMVKWKSRNDRWPNKKRPVIIDDTAAERNLPPKADFLNINLKNGVKMDFELTLEKFD